MILSSVPSIILFNLFILVTVFFSSKIFFYLVLFISSVFWLSFPGGVHSHPREKGAPCYFRTELRVSRSPPVGLWGHRPNWKWLAYFIIVLHGLHWHQGSERVASLLSSSGQVLILNSSSSSDTAQTGREREILLLGGGWSFMSTLDFCWFSVLGVGRRELFTTWLDKKPSSLLVLWYYLIDGVVGHLHRLVRVVV